MRGGSVVSPGPHRHPTNCGVISHASYQSHSISLGLHGPWRHKVKLKLLPSIVGERVCRFGLAARRYAGKQKDLGSIRFGSPLSSCGLWTLSHFVTLSFHNILTKS